MLSYLRNSSPFMEPKRKLAQKRQKPYPILNQMIPVHNVTCNKIFQRCVILDLDPVFEVKPSVMFLDWMCVTSPISFDLLRQSSVMFYEGGKNCVFYVRGDMGSMHYFLFKFTSVLNSVLCFGNCWFSSSFPVYQRFCFVQCPLFARKEALCQMCIS
jgi:hypothetical protein